MTENVQFRDDGESALSAREVRALEKIRVLERHCDHLMGQLYHQVQIIRSQRDHSAHIDQQFDAIKETPRLLDDALKKISQLKEDLAGRKEVELDLRLRVEALEREEAAKVAHIKKLESYLDRIWYSPHRRVARSIKNFLRRLLGRSPMPHELGGDDRK